MRHSPFVSYMEPFAFWRKYGYYYRMGFLGRVRFLGRSPLTIVELILAISAIVGGLYLLSPLLAYSTVINGASPLVQTLGHPVAIMFYGIIYITGGLMSTVGIFMRKTVLRSTGMFLIMLVRTYGLFITFLVQGFLPLTWLSSATVIGVSVVVYIWLRGLILRGLVD